VHQANIELLDDDAGRREADLRGRLDGVDGDGAAAGRSNGEATLDSTDYQLARAIDLLRGIALYGSRSTTRG
jgi:carboxyl-terminal processing protease